MMIIKSHDHRAAMAESSEGGYDYEFVDTPLDNLVCKICHHPSREPHLTVCCGHTFCKSCLENARSNACPVCRSEQFTTVPNKQNERDILSLRVLCTNLKRGCDWIGELNEIANHLTSSGAGCKFEDVCCSVGCGKTLERQYLTGHVEKECPCRPTNCEYCNTVGEYQFIEGSHKQNCLEYPIPCPNNCELENFLRKLLEEHRKVCPLEIVQCEYHSVGCDTKMPRKDLTKHDEEKTNEHLSLMKSALVDTQSKLADTQGKLFDTQNKLFDTEKQLSLKLEHNHAEVLAMQNSKYTQIQSDLQYKMEFVHDQIDKLKTTLQQKTDMIFGKWAMKIHTRAAELLSCDPQFLPVIVKVPDFMANKNDKVDWDSNPFFTYPLIFTYPFGYKMKLNVVPAGYGTSEGSYMSVYLYIMSGPHDYQLTWPLKGKFQVTLLNQICDSGHHSVSYQNRAKMNQSKPFWFCKEFISYEVLHEISATRQFIKDDCVFFEVRELL